MKKKITFFTDNEQFSSNFDIFSLDFGKSKNLRFQKRNRDFGVIAIIVSNILFISVFFVWFGDHACHGITFRAGINAVPQVFLVTVSDFTRFVVLETTIILALQAQPPIQRNLRTAHRFIIFSVIKNKRTE